MTAVTPEVSGVLVLNKHAGVTSHDMVNTVRRLYHTRRVGHTGTLDPLATGVLVILVGRAAKAAEYLVSDSKRYRATLRLGLTTDTEDITGTILTESAVLPDRSAVERICTSFCGISSQIPPMYSALKVNGRKLVDLARQGVEIERQPREIEIFSLTCTSTACATDYLLDVHCSSGTYIRTLCADIGKALGCGGVMATLERRESGGFVIEESYSVDRLEAMDEESLLRALIPTESLFRTLPALPLPAFYEKLFRGGCEIYQAKIGTVLPTGTKVRVCDARGNFFALGEVREYPDGSAVKSIKTFVLS